MMVLVACEFSGVVRDAFTARGHDAWSCDQLRSEAPGNHYKGDVREILHLGWDMMIAHPPCTHLAASGARHFKNKVEDGRQQQALEFFLTLLNAPIPFIAVENPVGIISTAITPPTQIAQPYWFGDTERKATCLWLKGLPRLEPTKVVRPNLVYYPNGKVFSRYHDGHGATNKARWRERSRTFPGIAEAMATQWGEGHMYWRMRHLFDGPSAYRIKERS